MLGYSGPRLGGCWDVMALRSWRRAGHHSIVNLNLPRTIMAALLWCGLGGWPPRSRYAQIRKARISKHVRVEQGQHPAQASFTVLSLNFRCHSMNKALRAEIHCWELP